MLKDYTNIKLKSARLNMELIPSPFNTQDNITDMINLIWSYLNNLPFNKVYKSVSLDISREKWKIGVDIVNLLNGIGDYILTELLSIPRTTPSAYQYGSITYELQNDILKDNKLITPSKDYRGAIKDIVLLLQQQASNKVEEFYAFLGAPIGSFFTLTNYLQYFRNSGKGVGNKRIHREGTTTNQIWWECKETPGGVKFVAQNIANPNGYTQDNNEFVLSANAGNINCEISNSSTEQSLELRYDDATTKTIQIKSISKNMYLHANNDAATSDFSSSAPNQYTSIILTPITKLLTKTEFYNYIGLAIDSTFYIKQGNKYVKKFANETNIVSFTENAAERAEIRVVDNASKLSFEITNAGAGYTSPFHFNSISGNPKIATGNPFTLFCNVINRENKSFSIENTSGGTYWGLYSELNNLMDVSGANKEFIVEPVIRSAAQFYKFFELPLGSKIRIKSEQFGTYIKNSGDGANGVKTTNDVLLAAEFIVEDYDANHVKLVLQNNTGSGYTEPFTLSGFNNNSSAYISAGHADNLIIEGITKTKIRIICVGKNGYFWFPNANGMSSNGSLTTPEHPGIQMIIEGITPAEDFYNHIGLTFGSTFKIKTKNNLYFGNQSNLVYLKSNNTNHGTWRVEDNNGFLKIICTNPSGGYVAPYEISEIVSQYGVAISNSNTNPTISFKKLANNEFKISILNHSLAGDGFITIDSVTLFGNWLPEDVIENQILIAEGV